jgi:hypothetical protein
VAHDCEKDEELYDNDHGRQQHPQPGQLRQNQADPDPEADESDSEFSYRYSGAPGSMMAAHEDSIL